MSAPDKSLAARAEAYFKARDNADFAEKNTALKNDDGAASDARWEKLCKIEVAAYRPKVKTYADAVAFLRLLDDFFDVTGVNDSQLRNLIPARLRETIDLLDTARR